MEKDTPSSLLLSSSAREWAQKNPELARKCLETPPPSSLSSSHDISFDSLESYLKYRHWNINTEYSRKYDDRNEVVNEDNHNAVTLLSHPLSYPLTLASRSHIFYPSFQNNRNYEEESCGERDDNDGKHIVPIRIACLGARSEYSLPTPFWREFLFYIESTNHYKQAIERYYNKFHHENRAKKTKIEIHWRIDFIGPDVPQGIKPRLISSKDIIDNSNNESDTSKDQQQQTILTLNCHHGYFHDYLQSLHSENDNITSTAYNSSKNKKNQDLDTNQNPYSIWNGFVLFNPGIGHPNLIQDWNLTINLLLHSNTATASNKLHAPILLTAHSELDAQRDIKIIKEIYSEKNIMMEQDIQYKKNPFASRLQYVDPFDSTHILGPNHSLLALSPLNTT